MSERWVQHKSGQWEKWKVRDCIHNQLSDKQTWVIDNDVFGLELPRSEFPECAPPDVWVECTREVVQIGTLADGLNDVKCHDAALVCSRTASLHAGYRWAWRGDALVIERKQP